MKLVHVTAALVTLLIATLFAGAAEKGGQWHTLFGGKSLDGWTAYENPDAFKVVDGVLVVGGGPRGHLYYTGPVANHDFKNFEFRAKVKTEPKANSGIYFHTAPQEKGWPDKGYECQVNNTHKDVKKTGGLYAVQDVLNTAPVQDGEWFDYYIKVDGKHIVIRINGKTTVDWTEPAGWQPPKNMAGRKISHGTFALQAHDPDSIVYYKDIQVRPLP